MQRARLNVVLAAVLIALGVGIYLSQKKEEKNPPLTALTAEGITHIVIEHPDAPAIKLEKQSSTWMLVAPVAAEADKFEVNGALSLATLERKKTLDPAKVKLSDLGLDPPQYSVTLNDTRLQMGGLEPLQFQRYVKVGDIVALTDDPPSAALDKDYSDLVSKAVLTENAEIRKIEVPGLTLERNAEGRWVLNPPDPNAGADQMQQLADNWKRVHSMWNEFDANAKDAKGDPVTITLKDRAVKFIVVSRDPQLQLERPELGVRFNLGKDQIDQLLKLPAPAPAKEEPRPAGTANTPAAPAEKN